MEYTTTKEMANIMNGWVQVTELEFYHGWHKVPHMDCELCILDECQTEMSDKYSRAKETVDIEVEAVETEIDVEVEAVETEIETVETEVEAEVEAKETESDCYVLQSRLYSPFLCS